MTLTKPSNGTMAVIWRFVAGILISVTLLLAGIIGNEQNSRIKALETQDKAVIENLAEINTKLDLIIRQHVVQMKDK